MSRYGGVLNETEEHVNGYYGEGGAVQEPPSTPYQHEQAGRISRPTDLERRRANRSRDGWNGSRSRSRPASGRNGAGGQQIEDVLQHIQRDWDFMTGDKCVPVQVALRLMDESSLGLATWYDQFKEAHQELQDALKNIVNEHHQGFSSSIATFHKIQASIQTSQNRVRALKEDLVHAKSNLSTTRPELRGLASSSQNYDEMLQVLGMIEQLQFVPEKLEARISDKRFISAVEVLQDALRLIKRSEMENIGALSDLKVYLSNQENSLTDILIEELHSHLYLKSPYCEDRWKLYVPSMTSGKLTPATPPDSSSRQLFSFLDKLDTSTPLVEDNARNPETDSFQYIYILIEALNKMSRLDVAVSRIQERLPMELFRVVDKANSEVDLRHPSNLRGRIRKDGDAMDMTNSLNGTRKAVLQDLLSTVYARLEAIAEGHRLVHDAVTGIIQREGIAEASDLTGGFKELWKFYQSEMRSILHDYLATDGESAYRQSHGGSSNSNIFQQNQRDKAKRMFTISNMDTKSAESTSEREDLEFILKTSVPGLVSNSQQQPRLNAADTFHQHDTSGTSHKLLVEPSVFNMGTLLAPSLYFINRLKEVVPPSSGIPTNTLTSFLDDFLLNVFYPQLEDTLVDCSARILIESDAFQKDQHCALYSQKPISKGTIKFYGLIVAFCRMLDALPHDQAFSQLVISQMVTYYDKCFGWFKALVTRAQTKPDKGRRLKASAAAAAVGSGGVYDAVIALWEAEGQECNQLIKNETALLLRESKVDPLDDADVISDKRTIAELCLLYTNMRWLASKANQLRCISDKANDAPRQESAKLQLQHRWTELAELPQQENGSVYLLLNQETAIAFDGIIESYQELASLVLRTLHLELRYYIIHNIHHSLQGTYLLQHQVNDPESGILGLNADLVGFDEEIRTHLLQREHDFIVNGLSQLLDDLLLQEAPRLSPMNMNGCSRMQLNILVLQQNLKNIESDATLSRGARYFELFTEGPEAIVAKAKEAKGDEAKQKELGFSYEELKALIELCYSESLHSDRREVSVGAKRKLDDMLLQLSEHMWHA